jgi:hypothetical protein|tara:strand:- start:5107 stop:5526 length:420 start_codon:yes stop_codon:yes gene_type:complete
MSYSFTNILEFEEYIKSGLTGVRFSRDLEEIDKLDKNYQPRHQNEYYPSNYDWVESGEIYLVTNKANNKFWIYRHPNPSIEVLWWFGGFRGIYPNESKPEENQTGTIHMNNCWVALWKKFQGGKVEFINWQTDPFEVKS